MRQPNNKKGPEGMAKVNKDVVKRLMSYIGHYKLRFAVPFHFDHGMYLRSGNPCLPVLQQNDGKYRTGNVKTYSRRDVRTYADTADPLF